MKKMIAIAFLIISSSLHAEEINHDQVEGCIYQHEEAGHVHSHIKQILNVLEAVEPLKTAGLDEESQRLADKKWYEGSADCRKPGAKEPAFETVQVNGGFYVMRQNKCINFEAPFLYLYIGDEKAILFDSGATASASTMPLRKWIDETLSKQPNGDKLKLIVAHSHSHGDHVAGDEQFADRPNTTVVGTNTKEVAKAFGIKDWPNGEGSIDLGNRKLSILPIPGHEASSIAVYDHKSQDLLTGDTIYPGNIFLSKSNFPEFKSSINRLYEFSQKHKIRNILGAHVEMSAEPGKDFPYGSTHHPHEHNLPMRQEHLNELKKYLDENPQPVFKKFADFIINI